MSPKNANTANKSYIMLILLSPAKLMRSVSETPIEMTAPRFEETAERFAFEMSGKNIATLAHELKLAPKLAEEVHSVFQAFAQAPKTPAFIAYDGIVFKNLSPETLTEEERARVIAQLRICSFFYGLLKPSDAVRTYRMEGDVRLDATDGSTVFAYWREKLTDILIEEVKAQGGTLLFLASEEIKQLFDWKRVQKMVRVVHPLFKVRKDGKVKQIVVYTKMMRGQMCRHAIVHKMMGTDAEMRAYADVVGASELQVSKDGLTYTYIF